MNEYFSFKQIPYYKGTQIPVELETLPPGGLEQLLSEERIDMHYQNMEGEEVPVDSILTMLESWERSMK